MMALSMAMLVCRSAGFRPPLHTYTYVALSLLSRLEAAYLDTPIFTS